MQVFFQPRFHSSSQFFCLILLIEAKQFTWSRPTLWHREVKIWHFSRSLLQRDNRSHGKNHRSRSEKLKFVIPSTAGNNKWQIHAHSCGLGSRVCYQKTEENRACKVNTNRTTYQTPYVNIKDFVSFTVRLNNIQMRCLKKRGTFINMQRGPQLPQSQLPLFYSRP